MDWSTVRTYPNEAEAALAAAVLEASELPVRVVAQATPGLMFGLSAFAVQVSITRLAEASEVLGTPPVTVQQSTLAAASSPLSIGDRERYAEALGDIRHRRRLGWILFLGYIPAVAVLGPLVRSIAHPSNPDLIVAISWMALLAVAGLRVDWAPCPRCGKRFHATAFWHNPWARRCLHCGLHVKADEGAV
jgi:hypothetical protein